MPLDCRMAPKSCTASTPKPLALAASSMRVRTSATGFAVRQIIRGNSIVTIVASTNLSSFAQSGFAGRKGGRGFSFSGGLQNPEGNIIGLGGCALPLPNGGLYFLELVGEG